MNAALKTELKKLARDQIKFGEPLFLHTAYRVGGPADIFIRPKDLKTLRDILFFLNKYKIRAFVLGNGSNILVRDGGIRGAVLQLAELEFCRILRKDDILIAGAGIKIAQLLVYCAKYGLSGLEFLAGVPASLGGAVVMNAGALRSEISDVIYSVIVLDKKGNISEFTKNKIKFSYRSSSLKNYIVISVKLKLKKSVSNAVEERIKENLSFRLKTQDYAKPSAGCVFRNLPSIAAGRLIEQAGLKGQGFGGAAVSLKHANFIINKHKAKASDIIRLIQYIKRKVYNKFSVRLKTEVKIIGENR